MNTINFLIKLSLFIFIVCFIQLFKDSKVCLSISETNSLTFNLADELFDFDVLTDYDNIQSTVKFIKKTFKIMDDDGLKYWAIGGTLVGSVKIKGMLPWDDDADICLFYDDLNQLLKLENQFKSKGVGIMMFTWFYKLYDLNGKQVPNKPYRYPYVDIFFSHKHNNSHISFKNLLTNKTEKKRSNKKSFFNYNDVLPLKRYNFEDFTINGPNNPFNYLNYRYPGWQNKGISYRHLKNRFKDVYKTFSTYDYNYNSTNKTYLWLLNGDKFKLNNIKQYSNLFEIIELTDSNILKYLPELIKLKINETNINYHGLIKIISLYKYGGLFIDCSHVNVKFNLNDIIFKLKKYEFISFNNGLNKTSGYIMASRAKRIIIENILKTLLIKNQSQNIETIIWNELMYLIKTFNYDYYYHYSNTQGFLI